MVGVELFVVPEVSTSLKISLVIFYVSFKVERDLKVIFTLKGTLLVKDVATKSKYYVPTSVSFVESTFNRFP